METRQTIKNRIKSIEGTKQITKSMRLVSIVKMQRAREDMQRNRPFLEESRRLVSYTRHCMDGERHPCLDGRPVQNALMVPVAGDRGLCGGYNASVIRSALAYMETLGYPCKVLAIGTKAGDALKRRRQYQPIHVYKGLTDSPFFADAVEIAAIIRDLYDAGEVDRVYLCHARFTSMLVQEPVVSVLLPVEVVPPVTVPASYEPGGEALVGRAVSFYLASSLYGALLEASVCEQSARILSMDGAVRTAGEMIRDLTLRYNQARQAVITREITEIVAGADASGS